MVEKKARMINKNMSFAEFMETAPESAEVLFENGMHCIGCAMAMSETLEQGAWAHGLDPDKLVNEINKKINSKKDSKEIKGKKRK